MRTEVALIIAAAFILDCIIGDPQFRFHPARIIGGGIAFGVGTYMKVNIKSPAAQFVMGAVLAVIIIGLSYAAVYFIVLGFFCLNHWAGLTAELVICYFLIAPKSLKDESMKVYRSLRENDLENARTNLSYIVGRDTDSLSAPDIVKAAVETVSENLSDGVIAPLIFFLIGGAPLAMAYKAINTLDSMIGYKSGAYEYFGKFAARLDDAANLIPSRVSALLMLFGSIFVDGADTTRAARVFIRDRNKHRSPNSGQTQSVCAGALGLRLGGKSSYKGDIVEKPTIGDEINEPAPQHIICTNRLMYAATIIAAAMSAISGVILFILRGWAYV